MMRRPLAIPAVLALLAASLVPGSAAFAATAAEIKLPVPVLDGGHIAILAVEGLARRDFSAAIKERILMAGFALIMLLMVTVIYNDVARLFR